MDWLSEIENDTKKVLDGDKKIGLRLFHCFKRMNRMVRVLRELAELVDSLLLYPSGICDGLSEDAKELCVAAREENI